MLTTIELTQNELRLLTNAIKKVAASNPPEKVLLVGLGWIIADAIIESDEFDMAEDIIQSTERTAESLKSLEEYKNTVLTKLVGKTITTVQ